MPVILSRQQRVLLLILFLLLWWPVASLIHGWQWVLWLPCWLTGGWLAWRRSGRNAGTLVWDGQWLEWQGNRYQLGTRSRILPGALWLQLVANDRPDARLWLFSDALAPEHYRALARAIRLTPPAR
ncbi:protein YgfX [Aeromonas sp.]|uniref:protein YgfX n=1 Tax=Aeromonas sp. TaxID=647 RepID=UPI00257DD75F|nr:protein YgfX [Aeromonas sp.]